MPFKSYVEPGDLPTGGIKDFASLFPLIKYADVKHDEKREVIIIKESIILRNERGSKIGVLTRSSRDHNCTVGDCSVLLHNDFIKDECRSDNFGKFSYDINDRLHEHFGTFSSSFSPVKSKDSLLIHYENPLNAKKYIFVIFEMICNDYPPPMYLKLKTRVDDAFIGMQDVKDVNIGIRKYNKTPIDVDTKIVDLIKPKRFFNNKDTSVFNFEIKPTLNTVNLTIIKLNIFGVG